MYFTRRCGPSVTTGAKVNESKEVRNGQMSVIKNELPRSTLDLRSAAALMLEAIPPCVVYTYNYRICLLYTSDAADE